MKEKPYMQNDIRVDAKPKGGKAFGEYCAVFGVLFIIGGLFVSCGENQEKKTGKTKPVEKIAFESTREGTFDIWVSDLDGGNAVNLTRGKGWNREPAWSPDGTKIAFVSSRGAENSKKVQLYIIRTDSILPPVLVTDHAPVESVCWSPDGSMLAFSVSRCCMGNISDIFILNSDGTGVRNLTNTPEVDSEPAWSPDGSRIAYVSLDKGNKEIWVRNIDGSNPVRLTDNPALDDSPCWSPDGTRIVFSSDRDGAFDICLMNADGSAVTNLTHDLLIDTKPCWSPDGSRIAFTSIRDGNPNIYIMNSDGSNLQRVTDTVQLDDSVSWKKLTKK